MKVNKFFFYLFLISLFSLPLSSFALHPNSFDYKFMPPKIWKPMDAPDNIKMWKNSKNPKLLLTLQREKPLKPKMLNQLKNKKYLNKLITAKSKALNKLGLRGWKIKKSTFNKTYVGKKKVASWVFEGDYKNKRNQLVQFKEWHLFAKNSSFIVTLTSASEKKINHKIANNLLKKFQLK